MFCYKKLAGTSLFAFSKRYRHDKPEVIPGTSTVLFILFTIAFFFHVGLAAGQNYLVRHYTVKDGLPSASIRCVFKDSRGLLWIGNDAALCTFDGKKFQIVRTSDGKTLNQIWSITEDPGGTVWFGSKNEGIYRYNGEKFTRLTTKDGLLDNRVRVIYYSKAFNLIAACSFAGANIIKNDTIITSPEWMGSIKESRVLTGVADAGNYLYFTALWNINPIRYYPDENKFVSINDAGTYYPNAALGIYISQKGDTLISKYASGVMLINREGVRHEESIGQVFNVDEDREGNIWMASWSYKNRDLKEGVFRFDGKDFVNFQSEFGITDKEIWTVYCDNEQDLIWVGTLNEGLYMAMKNEFTAYNPDFFKLEKLNINDLFVDSDTLWIADNHEMIRLFPNNDFSILEKRQMTIEFQKYWKVSNRNVMAQIDSVQRLLRTLNLSRLVEFGKSNPFEFQRINKGPDDAIYFSKDCNWSISKEPIPR